MKTVGILALLVIAGIVVVSCIDRPLFGPFDTNFLLWVNNATHCRLLNTPMWAVSHIRAIHILLVIGIVVLFFRRRYGLLILLLFVFFRLGAISIKMKEAADLPRPYEAISGIWVVEGGTHWVRLEQPRPVIRRDSFPSGHAFTVFFFFGLFHRVRGVKWFFLAAALIISFSRLYLGVHYLSDVIFGAMAGFAFGSFLELLQIRSLLLEGEK